MFKLKEMQKKGQLQMNKTVGVIVGVLVTAILIVAFAPSIFNNSLTGSGAPSWLVTIFPIILGIAVLYVILKLIKK